ncbi:MAG: hypothetical protein L6R19_17495 [Alphaproteobacteria bacterium]|nr:hypothetical protein [Alphaproteobacteria bacterium]
MARASSTRQVGDARGVAVYATPEGRALTAKIVPMALTCEDVALAGFDDREARLLKRMLVRVFDNMDALDEARAGLKRDAG